MNGKKEEDSDIFKLVKMIMQRNFDPVTYPSPHPQTLPCMWYNTVYRQQYCILLSSFLTLLSVSIPCKA